MANEKIEKKTDIKIPGISSKDTEALIADIKELNAVIQNDSCKEGIENALKAIISGQFPIKSIETLVESAIGEAPARIITFSLNFNDITIIDDLAKADVPTEAIDFIKHLTLKYGFYFADYRSIIDLPNDISRIHIDSNFDFDEDNLILTAELQKRNSKVVTIEGPIRTYIWLVTRILENVLQTSLTAKEKMPQIKIPLTISELNEMKEHIKGIEALLTEKSPSPKNPALPKKEA